MTSSSDSHETLEKCQLEHFLHDHPLIFFENLGELPRCGVCYKKVMFDGPLYGCEYECYFYVHKSCADELLQQQEVRNMNSSSSDSEEETPEKIQIKHIHGHPLIFLEDVEVQLYCCICNEDTVDGPRYGCIRCFFYIHKSCAELPKQVRNMLHPKHLLELSRLHEFHCDACSEDFGCSSYQCKQCDFHLDVRCVLEHIFEEPQGHKEHAFKISKPTPFTCDTCGVEEVNNCISCICTTCLLQVHKKCTNLYPFMVKEPRHSHLLNLTYSFQIGLGITDKICKICFCKMNDVLFMYSCADCAYFTHIKCGISTNTLDGDDNGQVLEIENEAFNPNTLESEETRKQQVEHFSHSHSLILNINTPKSVILCDGCVKPISGPFYSCDQCTFFLHQHCVELKEKIQHPLHVHELTLILAWDKQEMISKYPTKWSNGGRIGIKCYGCKSFCNGFMYGCEACIFFLDTGCSFLPDILSHEGHECVLTLIDTNKRYGGDDYKTKCSACGLNCLNNFICERCNFNLDLQCASLPKLIPHECPKHDWNLHHFELTYKAIEDGRSGKHYCDVCEEERSENHWFYYCQNCDYSAHPSCILGHDRIKYGSLHKISDHPHCVRFLKVTNGKHTCKKCLDPCEKDQSVFSCEECDGDFHSFCDSWVTNALPTFLTSFSWMSRLQPGV